METHNSLFIASTSDVVLSAPGWGAAEKPSGRVYHLLRAAIARSATVQDLAQSLLRACELAYSQRDMEALSEASQMLCNLPLLSAQEFGRYYQAICLLRAGNSESSEHLFHTLVDSSLRPQALLSLSYSAIKAGDLQEAQSLTIGAIRDGDYLTRLRALLNLSEIQSRRGNHWGALERLHSNWPMVRAAAPYFFFCWHNEVAYELLQLGQVEQAAKYSQVATSSPIIDAYPEWTETREQIIERQSAPVTISVSVSPPISSQETAEHPEPVSLSSPIEDKPLICTRNVTLTANLIYGRVIRSHPPTGPPAATVAK